MGNALHYAHERQCIHRDVTPQNILLDKSGVAHLTDFDLVRVADSTGGTRTGALGKVIYAAPESWRFAKEVDIRGDVYSLGMTAVFGFHGEELTPDVMRSTSKVIKNLGCSIKIKGILKRATSWEKSGRYSTIAEFCTDLERAFKNSLESAISHVSTSEKKSSRPLQAKRHPLPRTSNRKILKMLAEFDRDRRGRSRWLTWEDNPHQRYAIQHEGRLYPVKEIISMATGLPVQAFSGGKTANNFIERYGFKVIRIGEEDGDPKSD